MRLQMKQFPISFWNVAYMENVENTPAQRVKDWKDLGITLAMSPKFFFEQKEVAREYLDECEKAGLKLILCDRRTHWNYMKENGEEAYRAAFKEALDYFDGHPALFGFFVGDEPDADNIAYAKKAMRIQAEMAPHLIAYLNLLPWFDWIGERMGATYLAPYLDELVAEGKPQLLSYDCYIQMHNADTKELDTYFENLRNYYEAYKRHGVPFMNIVLSGSHAAGGTYYRVPTKDELRWQLGTSVAMGAAAVSWYVIDPCGMYETVGHLYDYRDLPINALGERTENYARLSEVNRMFLQHMGEIMHSLVIDECYHLRTQYGGVEAFRPFGKIKAAFADSPTIISRFHDENGGEYYLVCNNSGKNGVTFTIEFEKGTKLSHCAWGNRFVQTGTTEEEDAEVVEFALPPGGLHLYRIDG